jgi:hypothetical protein
MKSWGTQADRPTLKQAFFSGKVIAPQTHEAVLKLLTIFAQHLAVMSNQIFMQQKMRNRGASPKPGPISTNITLSRFRSARSPRP